MSNAIANAIEQAKANAANAVATQATVANSVPANVQPAAPLSLDQMMAGSMSVDAWLKVNAYGLFIGNDKTTPLQTLDLELDMTEIAYNFAVKFGNPATYLKSYDHTTCTTGGSWADAMAKAQRVDPKATEYRSADIPFTVLSDVKSTTGAVLIEAGKKLGHGLSTTGWKAFAEFVKRLKAEGIDPSIATVKVTLGFESQKNAKGEWGIIKFNSFERVAAE